MRTIYNTSATVWTTSSEVFAPDPRAEGLILSNNSNSSIYLAFWGDDAVIWSGVHLPAGGGMLFHWTDNFELLLIKRGINAISTLDNQGLCITYYDN